MFFTVNSIFYCTIPFYDTYCQVSWDELLRVLLLTVNWIYILYIIFKDYHEAGWLKRSQEELSVVTWSYQTDLTNKEIFKSFNNFSDVQSHCSIQQTTTHFTSIIIINWLITLADLLPTTTVWYRPLYHWSTLYIFRS